MKKILITSLLPIAVAVLGFSCEKPRETIIPPGSDPNSATIFKVEKNDDGIWRLYRYGGEFFINGAAANNFYSRVGELGGNAFRTYSTNDTATPSILSEAYRYGLYVNMGLSIKRETDGFDFNEEALEEQFENIRDIVRRYRNHPSVMCWSIGNEADSGYSKYKEQLWTAVNRIAEMIHEEDPNHPTTTVLTNADKDKIELVKKYAPALDILSINSYYPATLTLQANLEAAGWDKPYMITEFGPRGTWNLAASPRETDGPFTLDSGALVEQTSTQKASIYRQIYNEAVAPNRDNGCIGSFAFVWGFQTHGEVLTWYGLFDKEGNTFGAVDEIYEFWNGQEPAVKAPRIEDRRAMTLNGKIADDAIKIQSGSNGNKASVNATSPSGAALTYRWIIYKEGDKASDGSLPDGIPELIDDDTLSEIEFKAPSAGNYRLCVFATDKTNRKTALGVIPFTVE